MSDLAEQNIPYVRQFGFVTNKPIVYGSPKAAGTSAAGAVTLNAPAGIVTTEALSTAAGSQYTLVITNSMVTPTSIPSIELSLGTDTTGSPSVVTSTCGNGTLTVVIQNSAASAAFNGSLKVAFVIF